MTWSDSDGSARETRGYTRDISSSGAYIFTSPPPPRGQMVEISIHLPSFTGEDRAPRITVRGCVLRVDPAGAATEGGFSVRNEKVNLCDA